MLTRIGTPKWLLWGVMTLALLMLALCGPWAARGQGVGSCIYIEPRDQEVLSGRAGSFRVWVQNVEDLYGVQLTLTYDPTIIQVTSVDAAGGVFDGMSGSGWTNINAVAGTIEHVFTLDSSEPAGFTGSGYVIEVHFVALQQGWTNVEFAQALLADSNSRNISLDCAPAERNGRIRVVLLPSTATRTPTPSRTATATATSCCPQATQTPTATPMPSQPAPSVTPIVYINPADHTVLTGRTSAVEVRITNAADLYGAWVRLRYDPSVIRILDAGLSGVLEEGDLFAGKDWYAFNNSQQALGNELTYGATLSFSALPGPTGEVLARIHFQALDIGITPITLEEVILTNQSGVSLPFTKQDGVVRVVYLIPATPTVTPTPRVSATPSPTPTQTPQPVPVPLLYLDPGASSLTIGDIRTIEVKVANVTNLHGVEFHIRYNPSLLDVVDENGAFAGTQISFGPFLTPGTVAQNHVDQVAGVIHMAYTQAMTTPPKSGAGVVARFRIRALAGGATSLAMHGTQMLNGSLHTIAHSAVGGFVAIDSRVVAGTVYLEGRTQHAGTLVKQGATVLATTQNDGRFVFTSAAPVGTTLNLVAEHPGYLSAGRGLLITNTPVVDAGTTTLIGGDAAGPRVTVSRAAGCPGTPTVEVPGLPDGRINIIDLAFVSGRFGAAAGDLTWQPSLDGCHPEWVSQRADINGDGLVNILDIVRVSGNYGLIGPTAW